MDNMFVLKALDAELKIHEQLLKKVKQQREKLMNEAITTGNLEIQRKLRRIEKILKR